MEVKERGAGERKGVGERKGCRREEGWRETWMWQSKICDTQQSRLLLQNKTKKPEKGATTGSIVFRLQYTLLITMIQLIKYTRVSVILASL